MDKLGDLIIVDDDDERLVLGATGKFRAEVLPEDSDGAWRELTATDELVEFYDPTDIFGDLADALAEAFPGIAPEFARAPRAQPPRARPRRGRGAGRGCRSAGRRAATTDGDDETADTASANGRA